MQLSEIWQLLQTAAPANTVRERNVLSEENAEKSACCGNGAESNKSLLEKIGEFYTEKCAMLKVLKAVSDLRQYPRLLKRCSPYSKLIPVAYKSKNCRPYRVHYMQAFRIACHNTHRHILKVALISNRLVFFFHSLFPLEALQSACAHFFSAGQIWGSGEMTDAGNFIPGIGLPCWFESSLPHYTP